MLKDLPQELHRSIRSYGYNPQVSDEDLYTMILNLGYPYSLMSLYDRLVEWNCSLSRLAKGKKMFDLYVNDNTLHIYGDTIRTNTGDSIEIPLDKEEFIGYVNLIHAHPIDGFEVGEHQGILVYFHYSFKSRVSIPDYDSSIVNGISELYKGYSLQKEYQKLSIRKRYSDSLRDECKQFLVEQDKNLHKVVCSDDGTIVLFFKEVLTTVPEFLGSNYNMDHNDDLDLYLYKYDINNIEEFYKIVAFISPGFHTMGPYNNDNIIIKSHKLPFKTNSVF